MNELEEALTHVADVLEKGGHGVRLVGWALKVISEAASGETRGDLGVFLRRAANASDIWTYESVVVL